MYKDTDATVFTWAINLSLQLSPDNHFFTYSILWFTLIVNTFGLFLRSYLVA